MFTISTNMGSSSATGGTTISARLALISSSRPRIVLNTIA